MRVIAGAYGGRRLVTPRGSGTRPTSDRVREALCMMLEPWAGLHVVDLFAGSGALGIEALSRGAAHVDFVESSRSALAALERNLQALAIGDRARVWRLALPAGLSRLGAVLAQADVVLLDPPYGGGAAQGALESLGLAGRLMPGCRVVLEHHAKDEVAGRVGALERTAERRYGETQITFYGPRGPRAARAGERDA